MSSLFNTNFQQAAVSNNEISAHAPDSFRRGLGLIKTWQVKSAEDRAKGSCLTKIAEATVVAITDVVCTDIEAQRSLLKAGIIAKAVPQFAAMATELQARTAVSHNQMTRISEQGFLAILTERNAFDEDVKKMVASGLITPAEAQELIAHRSVLASQDIARLDRNVGNAKDALDGMVAGATSHIVTPITK